MLTYIFSGLQRILGGRFKQVMAIDPTDADFPAALLWYGLNQSTDRVHTKRPSPSGASENSFSSAPSISRIALASHMSRISFFGSCHARSNISSTRGRLSRFATKAGKLWYANGRIGDLMLCPFCTLCLVMRAPQFFPPLNCTYWHRDG